MRTSELPFVSIVIPTRNEEDHIEAVLERLLQQDHPKDRMEILVVDGQSEDATMNIVQRMMEKGAPIRFMTNPQKTVPFALNRAIREAKGEFIVRMDAHAEYPWNYISTLIERAESLEADNVGGAWDTVPGGEGAWARAIAVVTSHSWGIGDASYRTEKGSEPIEVDTVPFGCFRKELFDRIGMFDEDLNRNQDDELNARILRSGGRILLLPDLRITYYGRSSLKGMLRQFYQYGWYKPLVNRKLGKPATLRQFAPPAVVLLSFLMLILGLLIPKLLWGIGVGFFFYGLAGWKICSDQEYPLGWVDRITVPITLFCLHFSYGLGYIGGILRWAFFSK